MQCKSVAPSTNRKQPRKKQRAFPYLSSIHINHVLRQTHFPPQAATEMQTIAAAAAAGGAAAEGGQREGNRSRSPKWLLKVAAVIFVALAAVVVAIVVRGRGSGGGGGERAAEGGGDTVGGRAACALGSMGGRKHVRPGSSVMLSPRFIYSSGRGGASHGRDALQSQEATTGAAGGRGCGGERRRRTSAGRFKRGLGAD